MLARRMDAGDSKQLTVLFSFARGKKTATCFSDS
jgi:hypothetical protein